MYELVTTDEAKQYLQLNTLPPELPGLIAMVSAAIEAYTGRWFIARPLTEVLDSGGGEELFLRRYPVQGTPTVTDLQTGEVVSDFLTYAETGVLFRPLGWPVGRQRFRVEYTAGICNDVMTVPQDVKLAALEWIAARFNRRDPGLMQERIGDYFYTAREDGGMPAAVKAALSFYRVPRGR